MATIGGFMADDHQACDEVFVEIESAVAAGDWPLAETGWRRFDTTLQTHFEMEEDVLFPAIERATGMTQGPTEVMRMDHRQMRALLPALSDALGARDVPAFLGLFESMMVMIQQHNMKEEQVLYPIADEMLQDIDGVLANMTARRAAVET